MQMLKTVGLVLAVVFAFSAHARTQDSYPPAFEKLKSLVGEWEGTLPDGGTGRATYRLTSGGSVLVETMMPGEPMEMITVYHPDGDSVVATHYCEAKNQPRMRAASSREAKEIAFKFLDVTNLASPSAPHMRELLLTFQGEDHFTARWTYRENGKDSPMVIKYTRKR